ncbi:hypothetical protein [Bathymodiolus japonicus methanotrophic gill symbiont]|uniref:hypothetical protein n=1 Tax=Bathymodiolus japonicus methanotrophic gill symbiont TaxID=113269 RepID=UPI001C8D3A79|nr:hypothetical protein [Bathymodiolus japonicus methanotrophic gill symbiont]
MCSVCGGRRAAGASPIRCVGERITATGVPEFREVAWRACTASSHLEPMFRPLVGSGRGDEDESGPPEA